MENSDVPATKSTEVDDEEVPSKKLRLDRLNDANMQSNDNAEDDGHQSQPSSGSSSDTSAEPLSDCSINEADLTQVSQGPMAFILRQMNSGANPRTLLSILAGPGANSVMEGAPDLEVWKLIIELLSEPKPRPKLREVNTLEDAMSLIRTCTRIIVLTGAGVSVSCGIPDFRSRDGIYARLALDYPDLPNPQAMFDIDYFKRNPYPFFKFAKEIYPGHFNPSPSHRFIRRIEEKGKLKRNFTQNIDTLEQTAGIENVIQCHGSFAQATCMVCKDEVDAEAIREDVFNQVIPRCKKCPADTELAIYKPDIVFFGESLPQHFHDQIEADKDECDLLIVIGSSLKVRPVALIPSLIPDEVPQILINREPLNHLSFDVELLGNCDDIIKHLCHGLGADWCGPDHNYTPLTQCSVDELLTPPASPQLKMSGNTQQNIAGVVTEGTSKDVHPCNPTLSVAKADVKDGDGVLKQPDQDASLERVDSEVIDTSQSGTFAAEPQGTERDRGSGDCLLNDMKPDGNTPVLQDNLEKNKIRDSDNPESEQKTIGDGNEDNKSDGESDSDSCRNIKINTPSISSRLPEGQFVFIEPSRYVFPGAELRNLSYRPVYADDNDSDDDSETLDEAEAQNNSDLVPERSVAYSDSDQVLETTSDTKLDDKNSHELKTDSLSHKAIEDSSEVIESVEYPEKPSSSTS